MAYEKINWLNSDETGKKPINKTNLNHMDDGIAANDTANTTNANNISTINANIGTLSNLNTTEKSNLVGAINEVNTNYKAYILYENANGVSSGTINLSDSFKNYKEIDVITNLGGNKRLTPQYQSIFSICTTEFYDTLYQNYLVATFSENTLTINKNGSYYSNTDHSANAKIFKIIGYK